MGVMTLVASFADRILSLHGAPALALVFALPALEASAFVGFLFPGEIAVLLGGVLAFQGRISLSGAIGAAVLGAIVGDTVGYFVGRRWGHAIIHGTLGRLPFIRHRLPRYLDEAREYLDRRGGRAVILGRFTTALRVVVPGLAGMSGLSYARFFLWNAIGGLVWGAGFVLIGFAGGAAWRRVEGIAATAGLVLLALIVLGLIAVKVSGTLSDRDSDFRARIERLAQVPPFPWIRRRYPSQVAWLRARLDPRSPRGFPLTFAVAAAGLSAWAFGSLTQDVVVNEEAVHLDPTVERFFVMHRVGVATTFMRDVTWLGSSAVLVPLVLAVALYVAIRRRDPSSAVGLVVALAGAILLSQLVKGVVDRPRPPAAQRLVQTSGWAFPSGHATDATAAWGMLALVASARRTVRVRAALWGGAAVIVLVVGVSRLYLGAHWLTDVLAGFAGGMAWVMSVVAGLLLTGGTKRPADGEVEGVRIETPK
jgi:membrane protein DedA with SNARE-associated domain/membrane-associated phospholipid phosphatase